MDGASGIGGVGSLTVVAGRKVRRFLPSPIMEFPMPTFENLGVDQFPNDDTVAFVWTADKNLTPIQVNVNGVRCIVRPNIAYLAATPVFAALLNSDYAITVLPKSDTSSPPAVEAVESEGPGGLSGGGESAGAHPFNADVIIDGTVDEVVARLPGLTPEQLADVRAAENGRDKPRKGVIDAINAALAA